MTTVATVTWMEEADALRLRLEGSGIRAFLPDQSTASVNPFASAWLGGIRVQVADEDVAAAREILAVPPVEEGMLRCPVCGSDRVTFEKFTRRFLFLSLLLLGLPLCWRRPHCRCLACGALWKPA